MGSNAGEQSVLGAQQGQAGVPAGEVGLPNQDQDAGEQSVLGAQQGQAGVPAGEVGLPIRIKTLVSSRCPVRSTCCCVAMSRSLR